MEAWLEQARNRLSMEADRDRFEHGIAIGLVELPVRFQLPDKEADDTRREKDDGGRDRVRHGRS